MRTRRLAYFLVYSMCDFRQVSPLAELSFLVLSSGQLRGIRTHVLLVTLDPGWIRMRARGAENEGGEEVRVKSVWRSRSWCWILKSEQELGQSVKWLG